MDIKSLILPLNPLIIFSTNSTTNIEFSFFYVQNIYSVWKFVIINQVLFYILLFIAKIKSYQKIGICYNVLLNRKVCTKVFKFIIVASCNKSIRKYKI